MRNQTIVLPPGSLAPGAVARLHRLTVARRGCRFAVVLAHPPVEAVPEAILRPGAMAALVTHDPHWTWPDAHGEEIVRAALEAGGAAMLAFVSMADALGCLRRMEAGR